MTALWRISFWWKGKCFHYPLHLQEQQRLSLWEFWHWTTSQPFFSELSCVSWVNQYSRFNVWSCFLCSFGTRPALCGNVKNTRCVHLKVVQTGWKITHNVFLLLTHLSRSLLPKIQSCTLFSQTFLNTAAYAHWPTSYFYATILWSHTPPLSTNKKVFFFQTGKTHCDWSEKPETVVFCLSNFGFGWGCGVCIKSVYRLELEPTHGMPKILAVSFSSETCNSLN